jgi:drug/metabolite transporter (DMT)-like permease
VSQSSSQPAKFSARVLVAFACVYLFWGSTYVAIRYGVEVMSPFVLASVRFLIAGPLMLAICAARGMRLRQSGRDLALLAAIGVLILGIGNVGVMWAEQYLASGLAALLVAVVPLYVALLEAVLPRGERVRVKGWAGIAIGFAGLLALLSPGLKDGMQGRGGQLIGSVATVLSAFAWTCGSILSRRAKVASSAFVAAGWQMLFAGLFNAALVLLTGGSLKIHWVAQGLWSLAWLVTFGSLVGYTAYIYLLEHVPVAKVSTYAYINPIVAVILGALLLKERMVAIEYVGMAAILIAVYLVTSSKLKVEQATIKEELEPLA